jgi:pSer/pThr/pTyr-binding forkhead associated (FHA) protein
MAVEAREVMRLGAISGPHAGRVIPVQDQLTVGRAPPCELLLDDRKVSRRHATLRLLSGTLIVRDHGSLNGTWVNDSRVADPVNLRSGDRLRIGRSEFLISEADHPDDPRPHRVAHADLPLEAPIPIVAGEVGA